MDLKLKDKVLIITGGAKGIGEAIVRQLAAEGAIPVILDVDETTGAKLANELSSEESKAHFIQIDLCDTASCQNAVKEINTHFGQIDGLVNNAGVNDGIGLEHGNPEAFRSSLEKNLGHFYDMAHFALPLLKKSQGVILNIASKTALTGQGGTSGYAAAKGGVLALTREWAVELLPYQIRVNAVVPAEVMTPLYQNWLNSFEVPTVKRNKIEDQIPLGKRMTTAKEIANMCLFLLSAQASHITGQHLFVDGGYTHLDRII